MAEQQHVLMVPVHLDALYLRHDKSVLEPMADFSRLAYATDGPDANPDVAYLSEEILSRPFEDRGYHLGAGIHLHWALPDGLRKGTSHGLSFSDELQPSYASDLDRSLVSAELKALFEKHGLLLSPEATARVVRKSVKWAIHEPASHRTYTLRALLARKRLNVYSGHVMFPAVPNRWLVTRTGPPTETKQWIVESDYLHPPGVEADAITYPYRDGSHQPFRYMGRVSPRDSWAKPKMPGPYLPRLTAIGYGEPTFSAFYPNCHSVFGFYDGAPPSSSGALTYSLVGWYQDPDQDCVRSEAFKDALDATFTKYSLHHPTEASDRDRAKHFDGIAYEALEKKYGWKVERKDKDAAIPPFPDRTICFARIVVECARFDFSDPPRTAKHAHEVCVAVGNTGTEALSAYLSDRLVHKQRRWTEAEVEDQLEALHLGGRLEGRHLDIGPKFREARHEQGFTGAGGGSHWIVAQTGAAANQQGAPDTLPQGAPAAAPELHDLLDRLNTQQAVCDRYDREIESLQRDLFADWYKYMLCAYPPGDALGDFPDMDDARYFIESNVLAPLEGRIADAKSTRATRATARAALETALGKYNEMTRTNKAPALELRKIPAARYWSPNDPVVLIAGEAGKVTSRHGEQGPLQCYLTPLSDGDVELHLNALVTSVEDLAKRPGLSQSSEKQPWHPFLLEWQVDVYPLQGEESRDQRYRGDFVTKKYRLARDGVDLELKAQQSFSQEANCYRGRAILTPYAQSQLRLRIEAYLESSRTAPGETDKDEVAEFLREVQSELIREDDPKYWCVTQSLAGFNQALLMRKQTLQLPIDEPLGFEESRRFTARVRDAVGRENRSAPQPMDAFLPIRARGLKFTALRLVDTFGRVRDLDVTEVIASDTLSVSVPGKLVELPPRLTQPARLNFRWLGPSPLVCGWVVHNRLEGSLMIYADDGQPIGSIVGKDDWRAVPGLRSIKPDEISNRHLRELVLHLLGHDLAGFVDRLEKNLDSVEPEQAAQHSGAAFLLARPLAVARAELSLEIRGLPAVNHGWDVFRRELAGSTGPAREDNGFTKVGFPVRIGDLGQLNDGLVALWRADKVNGALSEVAYDEKQPAELSLAPDGSRLELTMLLDPRGVVHATSGILPVKSIGIPDEHCLEALKRLQTTFRIGPVLTPQGKIRLPLPAEPGYSSSWIENDNGRWRTFDSIDRPIPDAHWDEPQEIVEGWVRLTRND